MTLKRRIIGVGIGVQVPCRGPVSPGPCPHLLQRGLVLVQPGALGHLPNSLHRHHLRLRACPFGIVIVLSPAHRIILGKIWSDWEVESTTFRSNTLAQSFPWLAVCSMIRAAVGILAKAGVLLLGLSGTQRRIRLTATVALLDIALLPQEFFSLRMETAYSAVQETPQGGEEAKEVVVTSLQPSLDWYTLLGIATGTHLVDVAFWWLLTHMHPHQEVFQFEGLDRGDLTNAGHFLL